MCGLRAIDRPQYREDLLFLPRFDRRIEGDGVVRLHQETLASLAQLSGFGRSASLFALTEHLARVTTNPEVEVAEFVCRDVLNRALRNPDNHLRNTSVQQLPDGTIQLTPLYDLAPMYLDRELIARTCVWQGPKNEVLDDWNTILELLPVDDTIRGFVAQALHDFGEKKLPQLADHLKALETDTDILAASKPAIEQQIHRLQEIDSYDYQAKLAP